MISIIVTAFNVEKYIFECLESIQNQTYKNYEVIVINDGSEDKSGKIINSYCSNHESFRYVYQENSGVSVARNHGIDLSNGDLIMFVDGDDQLSPDMLEKLISSLDESIDIVACCCVGFSPDGETENHFYESSFCAKTAEEKEKLYLQLMKTEYGQPKNQKVFTGIGVPWGKLYRKSLFERNPSLRFNRNLRRMQDNVFNMYCFEAAGSILYVDSALYRYRIEHIQSYIKPYSPENYYSVLEERKHFFEINEKIYSEELKSGVINEVKDYFLTSVKYYFLSEPYSLVSKKIDELLDKQIYKQLKEPNISVETKFKMFMWLYQHKLLWIMKIYFINKR